MKLVKMLLCSTSLFIIASCNSQQTTQPTQPTASGAPTATTVAFKDVKAVVDAKCVTCHSNAQKIGGISFEDPATVSAQASRINRQVSNGTMPPKSSPALTDQEKNLINTWVSQGASTN